MTPSDLTADLPAPREDEPSTLRQDIADELADHLACAVRREQLRDGGAGNVDLGARPHPGPLPEGEGESGGEPRCLGSSDWWAQPTLRRVLERFGDPRAVARKLWWDAMREQMMRERILTGLTLVAVLGCCAMAGLMWQMQTAQRDMLRESQAQNAKLLEQFQAALAGLRSAPADEAPSEWNQLTVKCTFDTEDGAPAAGVKIQLQSGSENTKGIPAIDATTGVDGIADFGKVLYGRYRLQFQAPNGMQRLSDVSVMPGQAKQATMICPSGDGLTAITPRAAQNSSDPPPAELADQLWYLVTLTRVPSTQFWARPQSERPTRWVIGPQGQCLDVTKLEPLPARYFRDDTREGSLPRSAIPAGALSEFVSHEVLLPKIGETGSLMAEPGNYVVSGISVCVLSPEVSDGTRLLSLKAPENPQDRRRSNNFRRYGDAETKARQDPDFAVVPGRTVAVDVSLAETSFEYMRRVLAATPKYVPFNLVAKIDERWGRRAGWGPQRNLSSWDSLHSRVAIIDSSFKDIGPILSGVQWITTSLLEEGDDAKQLWQQTDVPFVSVTLLVTPEEHRVLERFQRKLSVGFLNEDAPRTELKPEIVQHLEESLEAKPEGEGEKPAETAKPPGDGEPLPPNVAAPPKTET